MTKEEIRQKAIECAKEMVKHCCMSCKECEYGKYFHGCNFSCIVVNGYEHGFADGLEEGKRQLIKYGHWIDCGFTGRDWNRAYMCSECGHVGESHDVFEYCPECGAQMTS